MRNDVDMIVAATFQWWKQIVNCILIDRVNTLDSNAQESFF